jgi:hypothetical protein
MLLKGKTTAQTWAAHFGHRWRTRFIIKLKAIDLLLVRHPAAAGPSLTLNLSPRVNISLLRSLNVNLSYITLFKHFARRFQPFLFPRLTRSAPGPGSAPLPNTVLNRVFAAGRIMENLSIYNMSVYNMYKKSDSIHPGTVITENVRVFASPGSNPGSGPGMAKKNAIRHKGEYNNRLSPYKPFRGEPGGEPRVYPAFTDPLLMSARTRRTRENRENADTYNAYNIYNRNIYERHTYKSNGRGHKQTIRGPFARYSPAAPGAPPVFVTVQNSRILGNILRNILNYKKVTAPVRVNLAFTQNSRIVGNILRNILNYKKVTAPVRVNLAFTQNNRFIENLINYKTAGASELPAGDMPLTEVSPAAGTGMQMPRALPRPGHPRVIRSRIPGHQAGDELEMVTKKTGKKRERVDVSEIERTVVQKVNKQLEQTVHRQFDRRLAHDSRDTRQLTENIYSRLLNRIVLEKERLI